MFISTDDRKTGALWSRSSAPPTGPATVTELGHRRVVLAGRWMDGSGWTLTYPTSGRPSQRVHLLKLVRAGDHTIAELAELFSVI
jgi:hypothetical protein